LIPAPLNFNFKVAIRLSSPLATFDGFMIGYLVAVVKVFILFLPQKDAETAVNTVVVHRNI
jgi:hypothetical protein